MLVKSLMFVLESINCTSRETISSDSMARLLMMLQLCLLSVAILPKGNLVSNVTVKAGGSATLRCSTGPGFFQSLKVWSDDNGPIGDDWKGVYPKDDPKYDNFEILQSNASFGQFDLLIQFAQFEHQGQYVCSTDASYSAFLTVEAEVSLLQIKREKVKLNPNSITPVTDTDAVEIELVCTAFRARPAVQIEWYNNDTRIVSGHVNETTNVSFYNTDTVDTISMLRFTLNSSKDGNRIIKCQTTGQQAAEPQSQTVTLVVQRVDGQFIGPSNVTVIENADVIFRCIAGVNVSYVQSVTWSISPWNDREQYIGKPTEFYRYWSSSGYTEENLSSIILNDLHIVRTDHLNGQFDIIFGILSRGREPMLRCTCTATTGASYSQDAFLTIEAQIVSVTISRDDTVLDPGATISVTDGDEIELVCTAYAARPAVQIEWFINDTLLSGATETTRGNLVDVKVDTISKLTFTPTRSDHGNRMTCRTTGQHVAIPQHQTVTLDLIYEPVVELIFNDGKVVCTAEEVRPYLVYTIVLNYTTIINGSTFELFPPDDDNFCTVVRCNITAVIMTGTRVLTLCPDDNVTGGSISQGTYFTSLGSTSQPKAFTSNIGVIVGTLLAALSVSVVLGSLLIVHLWRRHQQARTNIKDNSINDGSILEMRPLTERPPIVEYDIIAETTDEVYGNVGSILAFPRDKLVIGKELGRGAFGLVLMGSALGIEEAGKETRVAIKTLKEGADSQARTDLLQELELMKKIGSHPNVVKLLGHCFETDPIYVIVEFLGQGDLKKVLLEIRAKDHGSGYTNVDEMSSSLAQKLLKFTADVGNGMAFLSDQKCIHRDLAARNVLVADDMTCKVSDFGLARDVMNVRIYHRESQGPLPIRWMAMESLLDDVYTTESDVWSFGILMWEIVMLGARPYPLMGFKMLIRELKQGYRLPRPRHCMKQMYAIMYDCWHIDPKKRPTFEKICKRLDELLTEESDYLIVEELDNAVYDYDDTSIEEANEKI